MRRGPFAIALAALALAACGEEPPPPPAPITGTYVGQEIWISYGPEERGEPVVRVGRRREEARRLAETLRRRVAQGEDVGRLARRHSNMLGGAADGFTGVLPHDRAAPDDRDRAIASVEVGELTPLYEWRKGFGFARRMSLARGQQLANLFRKIPRMRVRIRAIALLYRGAWIPDAEAAELVVRTKEEAIELAEELRDRALAGEDFAQLAAEHTNDAYGAEHGGEVRIPLDDGTWTVWIPRITTRVPYSMLEAAFQTAPGRVHPEVVVSPRGVFVVMVEERKEVGQ